MFNKKLIENNIASINLFLSSFGIFLSYFYFGNTEFFYNTYIKFEIFFYAFVISIFVLSINILIIYLLNLTNKKIISIYNSLLFATVIFISFHYLIRFSDINYFFIYKSLLGDNSFILQVLFYLLPFIICLIFFKMIKKKINKFNKFLFILLLIFLCLSSIRILNFNYDLSKNNKEIVNDFKNFDVKKLKKENEGKKRVFFLIFDEFDYGYLEDNLENFPTIKRLLQNSFVHKNFYTPGMFTLNSVPGILTGSSVSKFFFKEGNIIFINEKNEKILFNETNTIFGELKERKKKSSIFGYYIPYCKVIKISNCYDVFNFEYKKINFRVALSYFFETLYIDKFLDIKSEEGIKKNNSSLSLFMHKNSINFLKSNDDLIYIHYPFPHLKGRYVPEFYDEKKIKLNKKHLNSKVYIENMFLVEENLKQSMKYLEKQKDSLLIITSDHWFKDRNKYTENKAYPVVFISKIIGDNDSLSRNLPNNASSIKGLIMEYIEGRIENNFHISNYFNCCKNHSTYIRWGE